MCQQAPSSAETPLHRDTRKIQSHQLLPRTPPFPQHLLHRQCARVGVAARRLKVADRQRPPEHHEAINHGARLARQQRHAAQRGKVSTSVAVRTRGGAPRERGEDDLTWYQYAGAAVKGIDAASLSEGKAYSFTAFQ